MQIPFHLSVRRRPILAVAGLGTFMGLVSAALATGVVGGFPPQLKPSGLRVSAAATHILIDLPSPSIVRRRALPPALHTLVQRGELLGRVMVSPPVLDRIARRSGVPPGELAGDARTTADVPTALAQPGSEQRASQILRSKRPYRLEVQAKPSTPVIDIYTQAPSTAEAERLANAAALGLSDYLRSLAKQHALNQDRLVRLRQLGSARGGVVSGGAAPAIALLAFFVAFALTCCASVAWIRLRRPRLAAKAPRETRGHRFGHGSPVDPLLRPRALSALSSRLRKVEPDARIDDDWPRTTRVLPWVLAAFMAMIWLVPFNQMELGGSFPIDLNLDRLLLPILVATWVLGLAAGGRAAPRIRLSWIHVAVGVFVACAFLSVVLNARYLTQTLELDLALKKLPLLVSYLSLFAIAASTVRRSEVGAFLNWTLVLATICAVGIICEYRFKVNLFYDVSRNLLPMFNVDDPGVGALDSLGRLEVHGPAEPGVEAVTMLCMALPIALVGIMYAKRWRPRILYGLAACALLAATFATYRKTAFLAPVSVGLTLAYFRRRELLRLAPLALVLVMVVSVLSPGAMGSTVSQFFRADRTAVGTVSDRTSDYDALRPDLWTDFAFGRGWGTYNHESYRILDSEILHRTVETGLLGLLAFLLIGVSVVVGARATIASRDPTLSPLALIGAAAAVCFMVVSALYDSLSFPHATYIFLYIAGLVAVVIETRDPTRQSTAAPPHTRGEPRVRRRSPAGRVSPHPAGARADSGSGRGSTALVV